MPPSGSDKKLHIHHVEPAAELQADTREMSDFLEREPGMQRDTGRLISVDAGDNGVMAGSSGSIDQIRQDQRANAAAVALVMDVNGIFHRETVCGTGMIGGE